MHTTDTGARVVSVPNASASAAAAALLPTATLPVTATRTGSALPGPVGDQLGERAVDLEDVGDGDVSRYGVDGRGAATARTAARRPLRPVEVLVDGRHGAARYAERNRARAGGRGETSVSFGA